MMTRRLIASASITMLILTGLAVSPARAQGQDEFGKLIAGAITLFIVGNALTNIVDEQDKVVTRSNLLPLAPKASSKTEKAAKPQARGKRMREITRHRHSYPTRTYGRYGRATLPQDCFFYITRRGKREGVYGAHCLQERAFRARMLPQHCAYEVKIKRGRKAEVFNATCLKEFGYRAGGQHTYWNDR